METNLFAVSYRDLKSMQLCLDLMYVPWISAELITADLFCVMCVYVCMCVSTLPLEGTAPIWCARNIYCVVMPLHEWATGSLPPAGRPPTRQVGPSEVHVSVIIIIIIIIIIGARAPSGWSNCQKEQKKRSVQREKEEEMKHARSELDSSWIPQ